MPLPSIDSNGIITHEEEYDIVTTITITGPGGTINYEAEVIRKALEAAHCKVIYNNPHAEENPEEHNRIIAERMTNPDWTAPHKLGMVTKVVKIDVNHCPWGG